MIFLDRYQLGESLTVGTLDTFLAQDVVARAQVLVCIFVGTEDQPGRSAVEWALQSFYRIAPPPPGLLLDAGKCEQSAKAYLITKIPSDRDVLESWVQSYKLHTSKTKDLALTSEEELSMKTPLENAPVPMASMEGSKPPETSKTGEFTSLFRATTADSQPAQSTGIISKDAVNIASLTEHAPLGPGEFTQQFFSGIRAEAQLGKKGPFLGDERSGSVTAGFVLPTSNKVKEDNLCALPPAKSTAPDNVLSIRGAANPATEASAQTNRVDIPESWEARANAAKTGTGDFTKFFGGPFGSPSPSTDASTPEDATPAPADHTGSFTRVFGAHRNDSLVDAGELLEKSALLDTPRQRDVGAFTGLFGTHDTTSPPPPVENPISTDPASKVPERGPSNLAPRTKYPNSPLMPEPSVLPRAGELPAIDPSFQGASTKSGATEVFVPFGSRSMPAEPSSGPSEFTRIISGVGRGPDVRSASPPPVPVQAPQYAPPPQLPQMQYPQMPPMASGMPLAPRPFSYWPLVIVLNVLLIAAVGLVLYFALKH